MQRQCHPNENSSLLNPFQKMSPLHSLRSMDFGLLLLTNLLSIAGATSIAEIKGSAFLSPLAGHHVHNVTGVVAAKVSLVPSIILLRVSLVNRATAQDRYGLWLVGEPSENERVSNGLHVFGATPALSSTKLGDRISLSGVVSEYRPAGDQDDLLVIELTKPEAVVIESSGHGVTPVILGRDRVPPRAAMSSLDLGPDGWLSVPNNVTQLDSVNGTLEPSLYGLDFWQSLDGQLVTIPNPVALNFPDRFGSFWVHGDWPVNGKNERGGLTLAYG